MFCYFVSKNASQKLKKIYTFAKKLPNPVRLASDLLVIGLSYKVFNS